MGGEEGSGEKRKEREQSERISIVATISFEEAREANCIDNKIAKGVDAKGGGCSRDTSGPKSPRTCGWSGFAALATPLTLYLPGLSLDVC